MNRMLLLELETPERTLAGKWQFQAGTQLIPRPGQMFWQEHSDRNWAPSVAAAIGKPEDDRNFLGRWGVNEGRSNTYVATARQIVLKIQSDICTSIAEGGSYDEFDVLNDYRGFLSGKMPGQNLTAWLGHMSVLKHDGQQWTLGQPWPMDAAGEGDVEEQILEADPGSTPIALIQLYQPIQEKAKTPYWVSVSRTGFRRLHRWRGCRVCPEECFSWQPVQELQLEGSEGVADKACRWCWPPEVPVQSEADSDSGSSGSSSDTTGSSLAEESGPEVLQEAEVNIAA
jgi:hypothetical protein